MCMSISIVYGQTNVKFFLATNAGAGLRTQPAVIYPQNGFGWSTDFSYLSETTDTSFSTPYQYRLGIDYGLSWRDQLFVFTGLGYTVRRDRGIPVCDVCGFVYRGGPVPLKHQFWEIPIGINYLFLPKRRLSPFLGASTIFSHAATEDSYVSWAFQWRLGTSFRTGNTTTLQLALYTLGNRRTRENPYYTFREAGAQLSFVKVFRKSE